MTLLLFDNGGTLVDDPFRSTLNFLRENWHAQGVLAELLPQSLLGELFHAWEEENASLDFPFASHFLQEEVWILNAFSRLDTTKFDRRILPIAAPLLLAAYRRAARGIIETQPQLPMLRSVLSNLRTTTEIIIAVASNDRDYATRAMLSWAGLTSHFDAIVTSEALSSRSEVVEKPNPKFFRRAEEVIQRISPIGTLDKKIYIGDNERNDIEIPKSLGYLTIRYYNPSNDTGVWLDRPAQTAATASYRSVAQLLDVVRSVMR